MKYRYYPFILLCIIPFFSFAQSGAGQPDTYFHFAKKDGEFLYLAGQTSSQCQDAFFFSKVSLATMDTVWHKVTEIIDDTPWSVDPIGVFGLDVAGEGVYGVVPVS
jgi:hypothetical protein